LLAQTGCYSTLVSCCRSSKLLSVCRDHSTPITRMTRLTRDCQSSMNSELETLQPISNAPTAMMATFCTSLACSISKETKQAAAVTQLFNSLATIWLSVNVLEFCMEGVGSSSRISVFHSCLYTFHVYILKVLLFS
jgi:hypothetical protein